MRAFICAMLSIIASMLPVSIRYPLLHPILDIGLVGAKNALRSEPTSEIP